MTIPPVIFLPSNFSVKSVSLAYMLRADALASVIGFWVAAGARLFGSSAFHGRASGSTIETITNNHAANAQLQGRNR